MSALRDNLGCRVYVEGRRDGDEEKVKLQVSASYSEVGGLPTPE